MTIERGLRLRRLYLHRAVKLNHVNEGYEARKKEDEVNERKRKAEVDKDWEGASCPYIASLCISDPSVSQPTERFALGAGEISLGTRKRKQRRSRTSWANILRLL